MTQTRPEPFVGMAVDPRPWTPTAALIASYRRGLDVAAAEHVPQMLANAAETTLLFSQQRGHLWLRQEWEFHRPLREGASCTVETRVTDIYPRRDRTILLTETVLRGEDGEAISTQRHHQSFLLTDPPGGEVTLRDPAAKEGASRSLPVIGRELGSLERTVSLEMCGEFFFGSKNYHSDRGQSEALGFRDVVVGGRMTMGYIGELLDSALGERWACGGRLLVKFTNVLWPFEPIRVVLGLDDPPAGDPGRETVLARVEKTDGTVVIVAEGSVPR